MIMPQDRRELEQHLTADLEATRRLYEVGNLCVRSDVDFQQCLDQLLDAAIAITGADKGNIQLPDPARSEGRRVGKECRFPWSAYH